MKPIKAILAAIALTACCLGLAFQGEQSLLGKQAPGFSAKTSQGKTYDLATLAARGPVFIYFIKKDCPINGRAEKFYNRIYAATGGNANFIGVINADADEFATWSKRFNAPFPVVLDHDKKIIHAYQAERSPWVVQIGSDGKVAKVWEGYSEPMLKELVAKIGAKGSVDFTGAPGDATFG